MRLVPKLALALLAGVFLVVAAFTAWRVSDEIRLFDEDIRRDQRIIASTAAAALARTRTREDALKLARRVDASREKIQVRFVSHSAAPSPGLKPLVALGDQRALKAGASAQLVRPGAHLRALLHDQAGWRGHWVRPQRRAGHRARARRAHRALHSGGQRFDVQAPLTEGCR